LSTSTRFEIPEKPLISEAKASSLYARHAKLRARARCGHVWTVNSDQGKRAARTDETHPAHRCNTFAGHQAGHKCLCGAGIKK
jgi:hypothetical protein